MTKGLWKIRYIYKNGLYLILNILVHKNENGKKMGGRERESRKVYKQAKKELTFENSSGILTKLSLRWVAPAGLLKRSWKTSKKAVDKQRGICYPTKVAVSKTDRESKTSEKKLLTSEMKFAIIAMFRRIRRVPCKLNNVTKRKHQRSEFLRNSNQTLWVSSVGQLRESSNEKREWEVMIKWLYEGLKSASSLDTIL